MANLIIICIRATYKYVKQILYKNIYKIHSCRYTYMYIKQQV